MASTPRKQAVALKYDPASAGAPTVVAKGTGVTADRMMAIARSNGVPIRQDEALVTVLSKLNIDQEIPPQLYQAVAAILAFLYKSNRPAALSPPPAPVPPGSPPSSGPATTP